MTTARDVISGALEDKKTIGVGASPTAKEMTYGLRRFNEMMAAWARDGIDLAVIDLAEGDTIDLPSDHLRTIRLNLARNMPALPGRLEQDDLGAAENGLMALRAAYFSIAELGCEDIARGSVSSDAR